MSRHNLLEMDTLNDRPQPKPRVQKSTPPSFSPKYKTAYEKMPPPPKPRTKRNQSPFHVQLEDDIRSLSSGGGDRGANPKHRSRPRHPKTKSQSAYDNPVFLHSSSSEEEEHHQWREGRRGSSPPTRDNRQKTSNKKERRAYDSESGLSSTLGGEEESYLVIEDETENQRRSKRDVATPQRKPRRTPLSPQQHQERDNSLKSPSESRKHTHGSTTPTKTTKFKRAEKGGHVSIQMENEEKVLPKSPPLIKKPPLARIWEKFRSRGASKLPPQEIPLKEKVDVVEVEEKEKVVPKLDKKSTKKISADKKRVPKAFNHTPSENTSPFSSEDEDVYQDRETDKVTEIIMTPPIKKKSASDASFLVDKTTKGKKTTKPSPSPQKRRKSIKEEEDETIEKVAGMNKLLSLQELKAKASKLKTYNSTEDQEDSPPQKMSIKSFLHNRSRSSSTDSDQVTNTKLKEALPINKTPPKKKDGSHFLSKIRKKSKPSPSTTVQKRGTKIKSPSPSGRHSKKDNETDNLEKDSEPDSESGSSAPEDNPPGIDLLFFGVTIHSADLLLPELDPNVLHPLVKVTLMTQDGKSIPKRDDFWWFSNNPTNNPAHMKKRKSKSSGGVNSYILPVMTAPFHFKFNRMNPNPSLVPVWEELVLFPEPFHVLLKEHPGLIIFFEVMDFLPMDKVSGMGLNNGVLNDGTHGSDVGWYKVAWAFLIPLGAGGHSNTDHLVRLQLYKPFKLKGKESLAGVPEIYSWWKSRREKLGDATLYVTVKGVCPPPHLGTSTDPTSSSNLRQLLSMRKEELTDALLESQLLQLEDKKKRPGKKGRKQNRQKEDVRRMASWNRLEGQNCRVPNRLLVSLPSSPISSLNLTISGSVHCLKFSPCGLKLAAGLDTEDLHAVLIFEIPSGRLLRSLKNHQGLIYELNWKEVELEESSYIQYLASASADSTAVVWSMDNNNEASLHLVQTLHHPTFVYTVQFHPTHPSLVATGCFDFIIRIWDIAPTPVPSSDGNKSKKKKEHPANLSHNTSPIFILDRHCSFVNSLTFDSSGSYMFSGDGDSLLFKWSILKSPRKKKSWSIEREARVTEKGRIPINSLSLHPNGSQLCVHLRDNCLLIYDTATLIRLKTIRGLTNDRLQIRSCFSPCGSLILSGNESSSFCVWDASTGDIREICEVSPNGGHHPNCVVTSVDYHPRDFYVVVGLSSGIGEPSPILLYTNQPPTMAQFGRVAAGVAKFKGNLSHHKEDHTFASSWKKGARSAARGTSSDKFTSIIEKLDGALKDSQRRVQGRGIHEKRSVSVDATTPSGDISNRRQKTKSPTGKEGSAGEDGNGLAEPHSRENINLKKLPSKSPRTYIEEKLEAFIVPQPTQTLITTEVDLHAHATTSDPSPKEVVRGKGDDDEFGGKEDGDNFSHNEKLQTQPHHVSREVEKGMEDDLKEPRPAPRKNRPQSSKIPLRVSLSDGSKGNDRLNTTSNSVPSSPKHF